MLARKPRNDRPLRAAQQAVIGQPGIDHMEGVVLAAGGKEHRVFGQGVCGRLTQAAAREGLMKGLGRSDFTTEDTEGTDGIADCGVRSADSDFTTEVTEDTEVKEAEGFSPLGQWTATCQPITHASNTPAATAMPAATRLCRYLSQ